MTKCLKKRQTKSIFARGCSLWQRYKKDDEGAFSLLWGLSFLTILMGVGVAYDTAQITRAQALAQYSADRMALAASIAVDRKNGDKFSQGTIYDYDVLGAGGKDFTDSITGSVEYDATDEDGQTLLARATITGTYIPSFLSIIGKASISFTATADVAYAQAEVKPASVFLILDNSGSMAWDDSAGDIKIDGLKSTVRTFMTDLDGATAAVSPQVLRSSMLNFSTPNIITDTGEQVCSWVAGPEVWVWDWWPFVGHDEPGPLVNECNPVEVRTGADAIYDESFYAPEWGVVPDSMIDLIVSNGGTDPSDALRQVKNWLGPESGNNGIHDMVNGEVDPLRFVIVMTDGKVESNENLDARMDSDQECAAIKTNSNTFVYTIGYDLRTGQPSVNGVPYSIPPGFSNSGPVNISAQDVADAQDFLSTCATNSNHYILADSTNALDAAFEKIGKRIVEEVIRVKH